MTGPDQHAPKRLIERAATCPRHPWELLGKGGCASCRLSADWPRLQALEAGWRQTGASSHGPKKRKRRAA